MLTMSETLKLWAREKANLDSILEIELRWTLSIRIRIEVLFPTFQIGGQVVDLKMISFRGEEENQPQSYDR